MGAAELPSSPRVGVRGCGEAGASPEGVTEIALRYQGERELLGLCLPLWLFPLKFRGQVLRRKGMRRVGGLQAQAGARPGGPVPRSPRHGAPGRSQHPGVLGQDPLRPHGVAVGGHPPTPPAGTPAAFWLRLSSCFFFF